MQEGSHYLFWSVYYTNNINKRVSEHNNTTKGAYYTKLRRPVELIYTEEFSTKSEALSREAEIKSWRREKKLKLINRG